MKRYFLILFLLFSLQVTASSKLTPAMFELIFYKGNSTHEYHLKKDLNNKALFTLEFQDEHKKVRTKNLSEKQAEYFKSEAVALVWENEYKGHSVGNCHEYAKIKTDVGSTKVCRENQVVTIRMFGFLDNLNASFK